jgi:acyl carrier protein
MTRHDVLRLLEETLELRPYTLTGKEALTEVDGWDSLSTLAFIAMVDKVFALPLPGSRVAHCETVSELIGLLGEAVSDRAA